MFNLPGILKRTLLCLAIPAALTISSLAVSIGSVDVDALNVRSSASTSSSVVTVAHGGDEVIILEKIGTWYKVNYRYKVGYMAANYLLLSETDEVSEVTGIVTGSVVNVRSNPGTSNQVVSQIRSGTYVDIIGAEGGWYKIKHSSTEGYIHPGYLQIKKAPNSGAVLPATTDLPANSAEVSDSRTALVNFAKQYIGTKYAYSGKSPTTGFDCSGFVYYVFKNYGYTLNPGASTQMDAVKSISKADLLPGDLVFFNAGGARRASHVGIYVGDNKFIHAVSYGKTLRITSMSQSYYTKYFVGAGRVLS